jgi:predicted metal-dependent hydrolase
MDVHIGGRDISFELKRSPRARWARLEVHLHRGVRVVLPAAAPAAEAEKLIRSKSEWLLRTLKRFDRMSKIVPDRKYRSGERLPLLGGTLTLEVTRGPARVERRGDALAVSVPRRTPRAIRQALEDWYVNEACRVLEPLVSETARRHGIAIRGVRISRGRSRWGSCSSTGRINLSWRLLLGPRDIVDYLIAHELAHVDHPDHAAGFWSRVGELHPAYAESERWLRKNGAGLVL